MNGKPVTEVDILFVTDLIHGLFGTPVQVEMKLFHLRIGGDALLFVDKLISYLADLA